MNSVLFRCDASLLIGSGHVIRCRTLARELARGGIDVVFVCRRQPGDLIDLLAQEFRVLILPEQSLWPCGELNGRALYGSWLGCSQELDADQCSSVIAASGLQSIAWMVVDHYGIDSVWETQLLEKLGSGFSFKLLAIDDLADRPHQADLLLDQNFVGAEPEQRYTGLLPEQCRTFLGPHYALLGSEYARLHALVPDRTELQRVLVFFGGVDLDNLTGRALQALMTPEFAHVAVDVVLGHQSPHREVVAEMVTRRPLCNLHDSLPSLAGLIARADLAIGACGSTAWERACLGLPTLVVALAANQLPFAEALDEAGYLSFLGDAAKVDVGQLVDALKARLAGQWPPERSIELTDGFGASRLALAMLGSRGPISLRRVDSRDEALLLKWANDPEVRANSFSHDSISPADHHKWFHKGLGDPNRLLLIAMSSDGCPIGQIRFDRTLATGPSGADEALIGLSLEQCARGCGLAVPLVSLGLQAMEQQWGSNTHAVAEVLSSNAASNACFERSGFVLDAVPTTVPSRDMKRWRWCSKGSSNVA